MNSLNNPIILEDKDLEFCKKARYKYEIANYIGVSTSTLTSWMLDFDFLAQKINRKLFTPKEVRKILEECK